jgi:hypothetical protein
MKKNWIECCGLILQLTWGSPLFSERNGYKHPLFRIGKLALWFIKR